MSDAEFIQTMDLPPAAGLPATRLRQAIAAAMGVPVETLHPADDLEYIMAFGFDGMDVAELVVAAEHALQTGVRHEDVKGFLSASPHPTLASLIQFLAAKGHDHQRRDRKGA